MRTPVALSFVLLFSPFLAASPPDTGDAKTKNLQDDIRFARDLARYRYFDLSVSWLSSIEGRKDLDPSVVGDVLLAKAEIARLASEYAVTREERRRYYDEGAVHYKKALESLGATMTPDKGEAIVDGYCKLLVSRGEFYTEEIALAKDNGVAADKIAEFKKSADESFREAVKTLNGARDELVKASEAPDATEQDKEQLTNLAQFAQYTRGQSYYLWALLYDPSDANRADYLHQCVDKLTDFIWDVGNDNFFALYAYYFSGMAEWELGRLEEGKANDHDAKALANLNHIHSDAGIDLTRISGPNVSDSEKSFVTELFEKSYLGSSQVFRSIASRLEKNTTIQDTDKLDKLAFDFLVVKAPGYEKPWCITAPVYKPALVQALRAAAIGTIDEMEKRLKDGHLALTDYGNLALLEKANGLTDVGNSAQALAIVKDVAEKNRSTGVGVKAQKQLASMIGDDSGGSTTQPASVIYLAVDGLLADAKYAEAAAKLQQVVAACTSDEDKKLFLTKSWRQMGRCYEQTEHLLEAALAYERGLDAARALKEEATTADLAKMAFNAWNRRFLETKNDFDKAQRDRAGQAAKEFGGAEDIDYQDGREKFDNANALAAKAPERKAAFEAAKASFDKMAPGSVFYERGLVFRGRCFAEMGDHEGAVKAYDELFARIADPKNSVGVDAKKTEYRGVAEAEATYYKSESLLALKRWEDVLKTLEGFEDKYKSQKSFFPNVADFRIEANAGLKRLDVADDLMRKMLTDAALANTSVATRAIKVLIKAHYDQYSALKGAEKDVAKYPPAALDELRKCADLQAIANERDQFANPKNLSLAGQWYLELKEWSLAAQSFKKLFDLFGADEKQKATITRLKPLYAQCLVELRNRFDEAETILRELMDADPNNSANIRLFAKTLGGWMEVRGKPGAPEFVEIAGTGKYAEAIAQWVRLTASLEGAQKKNSPEWWETKVNALFGLYMLAKTDADAKGQAKATIESWERAYADEIPRAPADVQAIIARIKEAVK